MKVILTVFLFLLISFPIQVCQSSSLDQNQIIGSLPYSNQWKYEKADSFLFFITETESIRQTEFNKDVFQAKLNSDRLNLFGLYYLTRIGNFWASETSTKDLSFWLRFTLEFAAPSTQITAQNTDLSSASSSGQFFLGRMGIGPEISWSLSPYFKPFAATEVWGYTYRHSASITAIDFSGQGFMLEPMIGFQSQLFQPLSATAKIGFPQKLNSNSSTLISSSTSLSLGMGVMF